MPGEASRSECTSRPGDRRRTRRRSPPTEASRCAGSRTRPETRESKACPRSGPGLAARAYSWARTLGGERHDERAACRSPPRPGAPTGTHPAPAKYHLGKRERRGPEDVRASPLSLRPASASSSIRLGSRSAASRSASGGWGRARSWNHDLHSHSADCPGSSPMTSSDWHRGSHANATPFPSTPAKYR